MNILAVMRILLTGLVLLASNPAQAQTQVPYEDGHQKQIQTRFGLLQVTGELGEMRIAIDGRDLGLQDWSISIDGVWAVEGAAHDWAVLTVHYGGNACDPPRVVLKLSQSGVVMTERFAQCSIAPLDLRLFEDAIELDFHDPDVAISHQTYRYDGKSLSQRAVPLDAADSAGAVSDVLKWVGKHPHAITQDASEQARFASIMTAQDFKRFADKIAGPGQLARRDGDWVTGSACAKHDCGQTAAAWALRVSDGLPMAVIYHADGRIEVFGKDLPQAHPLIWDLMHKRP